MMVNETIVEIETESDAEACFYLIQQLRPHIANSAEFITHWHKQSQEEYRLIALYRDNQPVGLAGYRIQHNLMHGRHLYVDDLVTDTSMRSSGIGAQLLQYLVSCGQQMDCLKLVLDTPLTNELGHRFYYRQRLLAKALRFSRPLI
ncbi:GNAT family N-acetyltransferase [Celerinatantimonas sp. YJH-8]|uniref:GNAT family N-acetyltransferase n=1 Tax=Celerinatantimonas sp. YJH-8 TaxID=3228714 RepID=UPI0038C2CB67